MLEKITRVRVGARDRVRVRVRAEVQEKFQFSIATQRITRRAEEREKE